MSEARPLFWPHEVHDQLPTLRDVKKLMRERPDLKADYWRVIRRTIWNAFMARYSSGELTELNQQHAMSLVNGEETKQLSDKYRFTEIVRQLGYTAPKQFMVRPGSKPSDVALQLSQLGDTVLLKPLRGVQGGKIRVASQHEANQIVASTEIDLIVQELVFPQSEYRYAVLDEGARGLRLCFERVLPRVTGDGKSSVLQLIHKSGMPFESKVINLFNSRKLFRTIPNTGETITLSHIVNIPSGGYEKYPDEAVIPNLDLFFEHFIHDLQAKMGAPLLLISFDFALLDSHILYEKYDFEKLKENIVFFESQMPFGFEGYTRNIPRESLSKKFSTEMRFLAAVVAARSKRR